MALSLPRPDRLGVMALALVYTGLTFGAALSPAPAIAKASGPYYTAELAVAAEDNRQIATGIAWSCVGTTCVAGKATSRPMRVCRGLQRKVGEVTSFTAKGEPMAAEKLAKCNGK